MTAVSLSPAEHGCGYSAALFDASHAVVLSRRSRSVAVLLDAECLQCTDTKGMLIRQTDYEHQSMLT